MSSSSSSRYPYVYPHGKPPPDRHRSANARRGGPVRVQPTSSPVAALVLALCSVGVSAVCLVMAWMVDRWGDALPFTWVDLLPMATFASIGLGTAGLVLGIAARHEPRGVVAVVVSTLGVLLGVLLFLLIAVGFALGGLASNMGTNFGP